MRLKKKYIGALILGIMGSAPFVQADFYVIPVGKKIKNVLTVAESGGDYSDIQAALDKIQDANATNPYLVYIKPGIYTITQPIQLKPYVTVKGSGRDLTFINASISSADANTSAAVVGANYATLTELRIENDGDLQYSVGIYNHQSSPFIMNVIVEAVNGFAYNFGVFNDSGSSPIMTNVTARAVGGYASNRGVYNKDHSDSIMTRVTANAIGGLSNYAIYNDNSDPVITSCTATGSQGTNHSGISNYYSNPIITSTTATGLGGTSSKGIHNDYSTPIITNVTATASGATSNYGVFNNYSYDVKIYHSTCTGSTDDVINNNGSTSNCYDTEGNSGTLGSNCQ